MLGALANHAPAVRRAGSSMNGHRSTLALDVGRGPALVLLHAFPLDHRVWAGTASALAHRARIVVPDLPGFGGAPFSAPHPDVVTMDDMARAVAAALDAAGVRPAAVGGVSMGGYVALALAAARPDLVPALVLVDTRARADLPEERETRLRMVEAMLAAGPRAGAHLATLMLPRLLGPGAPGALVAEVRAWVAAAPQPAVLAAQRGMAARADHGATLAAFAGPVLAIGGALDPIVPPADIEALAGAARDGLALIVPDAGHLPQLEAPAAFHAGLVDFLERCARRLR